MEKIDKLLLSTMIKKGLGDPALGALVCFWAKEWAKTRFEPISFSRGILKVSVRSSAAASELQIIEEDLIDYLNKKAGRKIVRRIRIMNYN